MAKFFSRMLIMLLVFSMVGMTAAAEYSDVYGSVLPISDELLEYTVMVRKQATDGDWANLWYTKHVEEQMGIRLNAIEVSEVGWNEKVQLAFATNNLPDLFLNGLTDLDVVKYGSMGMLIDQQALIAEHAPNIVKIFEEAPAYKNAITCPDGAIYYFKGLSQTERELCRSRIYFNVDWIEKLGKEIPTTLDELYDVLLAMKTGDPNGNGEADEIPLGGIYVWTNDYKFSASYMILNALGYYDQLLDVTDEGKTRFVPTDANYIEYLRYMKKLYDAELLDPEYFSQDNNTRASKSAAGLYGVVITNGANWTEMADEALYSQYKMIGPFASDFNDTLQTSALDMKLMNGYGITASCADPVPLIKLLNVLMSEQGSIDEQQGAPMGEYRDDGGYVLRTDENGTTGMDLIYPEDEYSSYNNFRSALITTQQFPYYWPWAIPLHLRFNPKQVDLTTQITDAFVPHYRVAFPSKMMTPEEADELSILKTELESYLWETEVRIIRGELELEAGFQEMTEGLKARGSERYAEIYQGIYDR